MDAPASSAYAQAEVDGYKMIRFYADETPPFLDDYLELQQHYFERNPSLKHRRDLLVLSGGAEDGAYGAGFLKGWTERGGRPEFSWVSGVSTGALIAPFAFLGSEYDDVIEQFYTTTTKADVFELNPIGVLFGASAAGDTRPLRELLSREIDQDIVSAIARESRRGRLLIIGTTNLDAQRHMLWNIGRIAESGRKDAAKLIQNIMLASASVPGVFPPFLFDVVIDGERYQELHVDGGITHQIFAYPPAINALELERKLGIAPQKTMWVIRNSKVDGDYLATGLSAAELAARSINTLTKYQGRGDLLALETLAKRDKIDLNFTFVPASFDTPYTGLFDTIYMRALYKEGYQTALGAKPWETEIESLLNGHDAGF